MASLPYSNPSNCPTGRIPVGINACLLGKAEVQKGLEQSPFFCTSFFKTTFELKPVCAELVTNPSFACPATLAEANSLFEAPLCGYIFAYSNTDCGSLPTATASRYCVEHPSQDNPLLPAESLEHLRDADLFNHFITRVLAYSDWQTLNGQPISAKDLIGFHSRYKYLVMAHSAKHYKSMGRLLANLRNCDLNAIAKQYFQQLMSALATPATRKMHSNTLMHLQGYLKNKLSAEQKAELTQLIHQYRLGEVPLMEPLSLLKKHLHLHRDALHYAVDQVYFSPIDFNVRH